MENSKFNRFVTFCEQTWDLLSQDEKEAHYNNAGIIGFIESCMEIVHIHDAELTVEDLDFICNRIIDSEDHKNSTVYGLYVPTDDITVIFEEFRDSDNAPTRLIMRGFYYGEPDDTDTQSFYKDYEAEF